MIDLRKLWRRPRRVLAGVAILLVAFVVYAAYRMSAGVSQNTVAEAHYVGAAACAGCHADQAKAWRTSHHAQAMQVADSSTVLGQFDNQTLQIGSERTRFEKRNDKFVVTIDSDAVASNSGAGKSAPREFPILYTFGVDPLQQYLVSTGKGRFQVLNASWDSRPKAQGGQRWFAMNTGPDAAPGGLLHWEHPAQNWNHMCADCHSTHVEKRYSSEKGSFDTRWTDDNVACESCHGPASAHVKWGELKRIPLVGSLAGADSLLQVHLPDDRAERRAHLRDPGKPARTQPSRQIEACAQCHSRRTQLSDSFVPAEGYANHYSPALLSEGQYFPDGQIKDEVYEYGSFLQSRMFAHGVECNDCHEPHSLKLRAQGNALCLQCHAPTYEATAHTAHESKANVQCVSCHMPTRTYMQVDVRHDHSFRVPRPDLTVSLGVPNACESCHANRGAQWAADAAAAKWGSTRGGLQQYAAQLDAIHKRSPDAPEAITKILDDPAVPNLVKATALAESGQWLTPQTVATWIDFGTRNADPTIRSAALTALESIPPEVRWDLGATLLNDPVRSVRIQAARALAPSVNADGARTTQLARESQFSRAWGDYLIAAQVNADRPEWRALHGTTLATRGETGSAVEQLQAAIALEPRFVPAYINLADLYREAGREDLGEELLLRGQRLDPTEPEFRYALGLLRVRQKRLPEAARELHAACEAEPGNAQYQRACALLSEQK